MESVFAQTYDTFHVIAVNDGSTDSTAAILSAYSDRITILAHEDNGNHGQGAALNLGLRHTDADYIAFLDNDDLWHPDKLRKQVEVLDGFENVGLVYTNGSVIDGEGEFIYPLFKEDHYETNDVGAILLDCYIRTPSIVMVRRSILNAVGLFAVEIIPDHDMWIRFTERTQLYYLKETLTYYRQHAGQLSILRQKNMWTQGFMTLREASRRYPYSLKIRRKRRAVINYRLGEYATHEGKYIAAAYHFVRAFLNDPLRAIKNIKRILQ